MSQDRALVEFDHNRLLKRVANEVLLPAGLTQRGSSRVWIDDHIWWSIVLLFDPSGHRRGTYLRVGSIPLWTGILGIAYEGEERWKTPMGKHPTDFIAARRPEWFERDVRAFAEGALAHVETIRARPHDVRAFLELSRHDTDGAADLVALGLLGMWDDLAAHLAQPGSAAPADDWAERLRGAIGDQEAFVRLVAADVAACRRRERLIEVAEDEIEALLVTAAAPEKRRRWFR